MISAARPRIFGNKRGHVPNSREFGTSPRLFQDWYRVIDNKEISPLNYRLVFEAPRIARAAKPGQFLQIGARGCLLKRPFSVCDVSGSKVVVLYKVVGKGTRALALAKPGDKLDVVGPLGKPFFLIPAWFRRVYVGGGVGVPPLYFLAKAHRGNPKVDKVFMGARVKHDLLCVKDFKKLSLAVTVSTQDGSAGQKGIVTQPFEKFLKTVKEHDRKHTVVFTCGPKAMMKAVAQICNGHAVTCIASLEEVMACGIGVCMGCVVKVKQDGDFFYKRVCRDGPVMETDKILWE